jgi:hypothetical protein
MNVIKILAERSDTPTRRQIIVGCAIALGGLAAGSARARTGRHQAIPETQSTGADKARTFLHQEIDLKATPQRI